MNKAFRANGTFFPRFLALRYSYCLRYKKTTDTFRPLTINVSARIFCLIIIYQKRRFVNSCDIIYKHPSSSDMLFKRKKRRVPPLFSHKFDFTADGSRWGSRPCLHRSGCRKRCRICKAVRARARLWALQLQALHLLREQRCRCCNLRLRKAFC